MTNMKLIFGRRADRDNCFAAALICSPVSCSAGRSAGTQWARWHGASEIVRKAKDVTVGASDEERSLVAMTDQINVIESAVEHSAIKRRAERVMFGYELGNGFCPGLSCMVAQNRSKPVPIRAKAKIIILPGAR
jgi:hypothetical protein